MPHLFQGYEYSRISDCSATVNDCERCKVRIDSFTQFPQTTDTTFTSDALKRCDPRPSPGRYKVNQEIRLQNLHLLKKFNRVYAIN